ncbi:hypothetical protein F5141DRAFT_404493 [Pisolithus sp. B1]|nr:hypothetical protein F5141DRAFT_404493 [Pisolithus sp. B1]
MHPQRLGVLLVRMSLPLDSAGGGSTGVRSTTNQRPHPRPTELLYYVMSLLSTNSGGRSSSNDLGGESRFVTFSKVSTHSSRRTLRVRSGTYFLPRARQLSFTNGRLYTQTTTQRQLGVLRDWEWREGMRRVDCLGIGGGGGACG